MSAAMSAAIFLKDLSAMLINKYTSCFAGLLSLSILFFVTAVFAEAQTGMSLEAEIQNLERLINRQNIPAAERHEGLVRLANLRQLSGDIEGAAKNWLDAANAIPGQVDDDALLACAYCFAAMGEWDSARSVLEPLLPASLRGRFLNISINAITSGNATPLAALADNPDYVQMKSEIYFLLWKLSSGPASEMWKQSLVREFPQSPEARVAESGSSSNVMLKQSPFWLFMGGLDSLSLLPGETADRPMSTTVTSATVTPQQSVEQRHPTPASESFVRLQTGIYGQQANAQTMANRLTQAGFTPTIEERTIGSNQMWAVTVPSGADQSRTLASLREHGFDAFPLR